jgi:hypothetical protein
MGGRRMLFSYWRMIYGTFVRLASFFGGGGDAGISRDGDGLEGWISPFDMYRFGTCRSGGQISILCPVVLLVRRTHKKDGTPKPSGACK